MDQFAGTNSRLDQRALQNSAIALALFLLTMLYSLVINQQLSLNSNASHIGTQVVVQYLLGFALMFACWHYFSVTPDKKQVLVLLCVGILARLSLVLIDPYSSSDVSRYLFDGQVLLQGFDPYRTPHDIAALSELRAVWQPPAEHAKYVSLYPPLALALYSFAAAFGVAKAMLIWKLLTTIASVLICLLAVKVLRRADALKNLPLIVLNPLLILEAGEGAHVDVFSALAVVLAILAWQHKKMVLLGIAAGLGASIKILPALLLIPLWFVLKSNRDRIKMAMAFWFSWLSIYAITLLNGLKPIGSLQVFFAKWRASSPLFHWLEPALGSSIMMLLVVAVAVLGLASVAWLSARVTFNHKDSIYPLLQSVLALPLLLTPVIFPWYLMPLLILFAMRPNWPIALWMISLPISYEVLNNFIAHQQWAPASWAINIIGFSLILGLLLNLLSRKRKSRTLNSQSISATPALL